jgi:raffinose/stachyose/melibiose transport system permease protein
MTLAFSFARWRRFSVTGFGGLGHYARAFADPTLGAAFLHNIVYILFTIALEMGAGLVLAGLVNHLKGSTLYRSLFFSPLILPSIVVGVLWNQIFATQGGLINGILVSLGGKPVEWLAHPNTMLTVSIVSGWLNAGFFMTIFHSGLSRIPDSVLEAAVIDGASPLRTFLQVELPLIRHLVMVALLIVTTGGFKSFDLFQIMLRRDPMQSGIIIPTLLVRVFFENQDIGYGAAISMLLTAAVILIMLAVNLATRYFAGAAEEY